MLLDCRFSLFEYRILPHAVSVSLVLLFNISALPLDVHQFMHPTETVPQGKVKVLGHYTAMLKTLLVLQLVPDFLVTGCCLDCIFLMCIMRPVQMFSLKIMEESFTLYLLSSLFIVP